MHDVGLRSPSATSPGARAEVGERVAPPGLARSLHLPVDWPAFSSAAAYRPRLHGRFDGALLDRDGDELEAILAAALARMETLPWSSRRVSTVEETSCGSCYGGAD